MLGRSCHCILFFVFFSLSSLSARRCYSEDLATRLGSEAIDHWDEVEAYLLNGRGQLKLDVTFLNADKEEEPRYSETIQFMLRGSLHRRVESLDLGSKTVSAGGRNPDEVFWLKGLGEIGRDYRLSKMTQTKTTQWSENRELDDHTWRLTPLIYGPFAVKDLKLAEIVGSTNFDLQSISQTEPEGLVHVKYRYLAPDDSDWKGELWLDPTNHWCVTKSRLVQPFGTTELEHSLTIEYAEERLGVPFRLPSKAVLLSGKPDVGGGRSSEHSGVKDRLVYTLVEFTQEDVPEEMFELKSFGISAPRGGLNGYFMVALVAGLLFLLSGIALSRRRASQENSVGSPRT